MTSPVNNTPPGSAAGLPRLPLPKPQQTVAAPSTAAPTPAVPFVFSRAILNAGMQMYRNT